jgi:hypothetical protein
LQAGQNITLTYNDAADSLTLSSPDVSAVSSSPINKLAPVYITVSGDAEHAAAGVAATAEAIGLAMATVAGAVSVDIKVAGTISGTVPEWTLITGGPLVPGETYVLHPTIAGRLMTANAFMMLPPLVNWSYVRIGVASSATAMSLSIEAPYVFL